MSSSDKQNASGRAKPRPWLAASPILRGDENVEGIAILNELPDSVGLRLWQHYRAVMQWISHPERRTGMQLPSSTGWEEKELLTLPIKLSGAFVILDGLRTDPVAVPPEHVIQACLNIASWAGGGDHKAINLAFVQAAALLRPADAKLACEVGRLARDLGDAARAESWLRRAIRHARSSQDWETYAVAHLVLAGMYTLSGNYPAARALATRGLKTCIRHRVRLYTGYAYHYLFVIAAETGKIKEANDLATHAFESFGQKHLRIPALAHDVACFWLNHGQFARALTVFSALSPAFTNPDDCALIAANAARAAAGVADYQTYEIKRGESLRTLDQRVSPARRGEVYLALAKGAALAGDFDGAQSWAERAHEIAAKHRFAQLRLQAEAELDAIRSEYRAAAARKSESIGTKERAEWLAGHLVESLRSSRDLTTTQRC